MSTSKEIATIGERRKFFSKIIQPDNKSAKLCSCEELFTNCVFFNTIKEGLFQKTTSQRLSQNFTEFQFYKNKYLNKIAQKTLQNLLFHKLSYSWLPYASQFNRYKDLNILLIQEILRQKDCPVFLDSSKTINHLIYLSQIQEFDVHVIWLSRDPRAQVCSAVKYNNWSLYEATERWIKEMNSNKKLLNSINIKHTTLRYEELCRKPEKEMEKVFKFLELAHSKFSLDFRQQNLHVMGNHAMRLGTDTKIKERKEWQKKLTPEQISNIENMTSGYKSYYS